VGQIGIGSTNGDGPKTLWFFLLLDTGTVAGHDCIVGHVVKVGYLPWRLRRSYVRGRAEGDLKGEEDGFVYSLSRCGV
jgi:hypothetical protein